MYDFVISALQSGGWVLLPIFIAAMCGWFIIFKSIFRLRKLGKLKRRWASEFRHPRFVERWFRKTHNSGEKKRIKNSMPGRVLSRIYLHKKQGRNAMLNAYDEELKFLDPELTKGLSTLAVLTGVAPLLGLLGTVSGMVGTFEVISLFGTGNPALMADSIGEALVTTQNGLLVALPLMICHILLMNKSYHIESSTEKSAQGLINYLEEKSTKKGNDYDATTA